MNSILIGSVASSLCKALGALPAMLFTNVTHRGRDILLALTAGIMVFASTYGLIPSALKFFVLAVGILLGTIILTLMELFVLYEDPEHSKMKSPHAASSFLFLSALALHNLPEGLSVVSATGVQIMILRPFEGSPSVSHAAGIDCFLYSAYLYAALFGESGARYGIALFFA